MSTLVMKFGGTSVGSVETIKQAADIVLDYSKKWDRLVVVVSAMNGVTDALIESAKTAVSEEEEVFHGIIADGGKVKEYKIEPPQEPNDERVPITEAHRQGVTDPMTGALARISGAGDMRVAEACQRGAFALKALDEPTLVCEVGVEGLDGHKAVEDGLVGLVDVGHAAAASLGDDLVPAEGAADQTAHRTAASTEAMLSVESVVCVWRENIAAMTPPRSLPASSHWEWGQGWHFEAPIRA